MTDPADQLCERLLVLRCQAGSRAAFAELAGLAVLLWLLAATAIGLVLYGFYGEFLPYQRGLMRAAEQAPPDASSRHAATQLRLAAFEKAMLVVAAAVVILSLAALCTIVLVLYSRRATLRHVDAGLAEIAELLKQLRDARGK